MAGLDLTALKRRAAGLLQGFTRGQKTMLAVAIVAAVVGAYLFMSWASAPSWAPLYSGLPAKEAAGVTDELDSMGISYKLEGGDTILVPRDDVYQARLDLSAKGLPADGVAGYDLLDDQGITTSEFKQRVDYQRALEGELVRTITTIDGVEGADVHLVIPEDDLFSEDAVRPTASVLLRTGSNVTLSSGQVQSVVHLVASSVEGLQSTDITVADHTGRMLAAPGQDGASALAGDARTSQTAAFEQRLARSIQDVLNPLTGVGRSRVQVTADLDFNQRELTSETFSEPGTAPVVSESSVDESYAGGNNAVGGVLGPDAVPVTDSGDGATDYTKTQADRTYAVDKVTEQVKTAPGDVRRLSVAVLLDEGTKVEVAKVRDLVAAAAGLDLERGDQLEVTAQAFDASAIPAALDPVDGDAGEPSPLLPLLQVVATVLIIVVVLFLAWRSARRSSVARYPLALPVGPIALGDGSTEHLLDDELTRVLDAPAGLAIGPNAEEQHQMVVQSQIGDLIDRQPDEVAQVLRGWLAERRS
ncbi:MAG: flagellar M-ring protein FliF [Actinomycetota bacterium]|nr:flagellar M-ring protein FliF [Actinomycetota bacterium]